MDFALSDEQEAVFEMARDFGARHIAPFARTWEAEGTIPKELWPKVAELGLAGIYVAEDHGGSGLTRLDATLVFEALSMSCASVAAFLSIHNMCAKMIESYGSDDLRARWLPRALTMETVFSYCLTEPGSGSDAAALRTRAERTNSGYAPHRNQGLHLGRGLFGRLCRHVPHGRGRAAGHLHRDRRGRDPRPLLRRARGQDGLAVAAHPAGPVRRLRGAGRQPSGRGGARLPLCHGGARRRAAQHRGLFAGRRAGGA
jgi:hypothetical protein